LVDGSVRTYTLDPTDLRIPKAQTEDLISGTPEENAETVMRLLNGERGPKRDIVALNAAAAIVAGGKAGYLKEGLTLAIDSIDSGKALKKLEGLKAKSNA
jgi:anthranilate phosphoribosyltransferase